MLSGVDPADDPAQPRRLLRHERLEPGDLRRAGDSATPSTVLFLSLIYFPLLAASVCLAVVQVYAKMTTQRRWRAWLTHHLLDRWLKNGRYYQLNLVTGDHKNPEYRIADDVRVATESPVDFVIRRHHRGACRR